MNIISKKSKKNDIVKPIDRRKFMITAGNTAVGIAGAGIVGMTYEFISPNVRLEIPSRLKIGSPEDFQPNTVFFNEEYRLFIVRNKKGYFYALSSVCTHLGCLINWRPVSVPGYPDGAISCPCHGSIFNKVGSVVRGPASRALDRYRIQLEDGKLFVDTKNLVSEQDMYLKI